MASWYRKTKEIATGIGVDDHTALCIDSDKKATVYGTGAVSLFTT
jgi:cyanophycinase-like exopeptidase